MSAPVTEERTWTKEQLNALSWREIQAVAMRLHIRANQLRTGITKSILKLQQSRHADAAPLPESSPESLPELPPEPSPKPPAEPSPQPPGSQPTQRALSVFEDPDQEIASSRKVGSQGSNPSQDSVSSHGIHRRLGSNTSPLKDKGKSRETEAAQLKGSSGEGSSFATSIAVQQATDIARTPKIKGAKKKLRRPKSHAAEPIVPQSQELNQTNDSQGSQHQVQQIVLASDGSSLNLSNSNRTASSAQSWLFASFDTRLSSFDGRLKKLESSVSVESVRDQVTDLHKEIDSFRADLEKVNTQLSEVQTRNLELEEANAKIVRDNTELRTDNAEIRKENADQKTQLATLWDRLADLEALVKRKAPVPDSKSSSTDLEGDPAPKLGSPPPIDEAKTPKPDTTPKAAPRHLDVASTSGHAPLSLPVFSPLPPPNGPPCPVEIRPTSRPSSQTPSGSQPSPAPSRSRFLGTSRKRNRDTLEEPELTGPGPSVARSTSVPSPKRVKPISAIADEEEDSTPFQRTSLGGEPVRSDFTTPPNAPLANTPSTPVLVSRPDFPFNRGSPSPQQRHPPRTPPVGNLSSLRHRVPSPARRPGTDSSSAGPTRPLVGDAIPGAPVQVVAIPFRGDDTRLTPEPASGKVWPDHHRVSPSTLASAVGGIFNPPSSSTPARPGSSSLLMRTSAAISRPARVSRPYDRPTFLSPPPPLPPAISASRPAASGHDSDGSQNSNGSNSSEAEGANRVPAPVAEPATPGNATARDRRGMPHSEPAQPSGSLDPLRFTGAHQAVGGRGHRTPTTPEIPDRSVRQVAPETPMASSTRYGTEINPSMRHLY